jgi:hypothetical protein
VSAPTQPLEPPDARAQAFDHTVLRDELRIKPPEES